MQVQRLEPGQPLRPKPYLFECRRARVRFQRLPQRSFVNPVRLKQAIDCSASLFSQGAGRTPGKALMRVSRSWSTKFSCAVGEWKDGAMSAFSESDSLLYASGYIPFLRTYPGARVLQREWEKPGAENDSYYLRIERTFP
jgi:hypothetical protein